MIEASFLLRLLQHFTLSVNERRCCCLDVYFAPQSAIGNSMASVKEIFQMMKRQTKRFAGSLPSSVIHIGVSPQVFPSTIELLCYLQSLQVSSCRGELAS